MKGLSILLLLLLLAAGAASESKDTFVFERDKLTVREDNTIIEYQSFEQIPVGLDLMLPAAGYLLPLDQGENVGSISVRSIDPVSLGYVALWVSLEDLTTSDSHVYDSSLKPALLQGAGGMQVVHVTGEIRLADRRFADVVLFPVTVDSSGQLLFNQSVQIMVGNRMVSVDDPLRRDCLDSLVPAPKRARSQAAGSQGPEYVIITSGVLAETLQPLAAYKNETGYHTEIRLIESILASYAGRDDAEKLREYLKSFHSEGGCYVLLAGDETVLPVRYAYHHNTDTCPELDRLQICDLYFADLTGEWDLDNDGIWGERYHDRADLIPELRVGRLPIGTATEASNYINKLIRYETDPGAGDRDYLERSFFFSSDEMRDYHDEGQHTKIAAAYPDWFDIDTITGVEATRGDDPTPTNIPPVELAPFFQDGYGIVNVIAHGRSDGFVVKSSGYNDWPKAYLLTEEQTDVHGCLDSLHALDKPGFYYSLACENGGFDMDQPPYEHGSANMAQALLGGKGGAVGLVAYSRWGWISSSHFLQKTFFDSLFAHPEQPAVEAMYASKATWYYYGDLVYGQNYFGDPTLRVYTRTPDCLSINATVDADGVCITVGVGTEPAGGCQVVLAQGSVQLAEYITDDNGRAVIDYPIDPTAEYKISAVRTGATISQAKYIQSMVTSVEDEPGTLPHKFALHQNYPNPFNPMTVITFDLPEPSAVHVVVFNLLGQTVTTLVDDHLSTGSHRAKWDGRDWTGNRVASGVYFYRLRTEQKTAVRKMIYLK